MADNDAPVQRRGFLQNVAAHALGGLIAAVTFAVGSFFISYAAAHLKMPALPTGLYGFVLLLGLYTTTLGVVLTYRAWSRKSHVGSASSLAFRIMLEECTLLQKMYRRLSFDDPQ